jgi:hypothetical protein
MVESSSLDPRQILAQRLRALREERWPKVKVTQPQLARALGGQRPLSVPLVSSWESRTNPTIPPIPRLEAYATFFASTRSVEGQEPRLLNPADMTDAERRARDELTRELLHLRNTALRAANVTVDHQATDALNTGLLRFGDGMPVTIVCAQLPADKLERMPYTDPADPDHVALYSYADLDALVELHGHVRAANPTSQVNWRAAHQLEPDDYTAHLISLGGVDWNVATQSVLDRLRLPVRQVADWNSPEGPYFEVDEGGRAVKHYPSLELSEGRQALREDVALFARAANPYNRKRTVTICNGMYGSGSYGAVRALTDERFRDRNGEYLDTHFSGSELFCILTRVTVANGVPLTPDWTIAENRLFEWSS